MKRVLIVDDSVDTINLIKRIFNQSKSGDLLVDYAFSGTEALLKFNHNNYNCVILDVALPDITGYYLGQKIRDVCEDMPIAFLTNYDGDITKENAEIISAELWTKAEIFTNMKDFVRKVLDLSSEEAFGNKANIELPSFV